MGVDQLTIRDENHIPRMVARTNAAWGRVAEKVGEYLADKIEKKILSQDPTWPPNAPATIRAKKSSKVYINTGELFDLIQSQRIARGKDETVIEVGIFEHEKGLVAHFLEFGTEYIPERPLLRLVFEEQKDNLVKLVEKWYWEEIARY
ncbi:hypothetical protein [Methanoregula sp.]|uniref:hypothetical protein n=1 Tax=Methanoregula sp. TaxID=2052170 RepID=UPI000CB18CC7|nr:hypothetical protein [Methanoregula sp.]PKG31720.1 MAG: hypothetical protein CW742_11925 [Methanoregula sp.]